MHGTCSEPSRNDEGARSHLSSGRSTHSDHTKPAQRSAHWMAESLAESAPLQLRLRSAAARELFLHLDHSAFASGCRFSDHVSGCTNLSAAAAASSESGVSANYAHLQPVAAKHFHDLRAASAIRSPSPIECISKPGPAPLQLPHSREKSSSTGASPGFAPPEESRRSPCPCRL